MQAPPRPAAGDREGWSRLPRDHPDVSGMNAWMPDQRIEWDWDTVPDPDRTWRAQWHLRSWGTKMARRARRSKPFARKVANWRKRARRGPTHVWLLRLQPGDPAGPDPLLLELFRPQFLGVDRSGPSRLTGW